MFSCFLDAIQTRLGSNQLKHLGLFSAVEGQLEAADNKKSRQI